MQLKLWVCSEERIDLLGLVRREVVGDNVNLFAPGLVPWVRRDSPPMRSVVRDGIRKTDRRQ